MAVSRKREYLADATGAQLTRNPLALAEALEKLDQAPSPPGRSPRGQRICASSIPAPASFPPRRDGSATSSPAIRQSGSASHGSRGWDISWPSRPASYRPTADRGDPPTSVAGCRRSACRTGGSGRVGRQSCGGPPPSSPLGPAGAVAVPGRVDRYKLVERDRIREALLFDSVVIEAISQHAALHRQPESEVRVRVNQYVDEIVPFFNVLSYYRSDTISPVCSSTCSTSPRSSIATRRRWTGFPARTWWCT